MINLSLKALISATAMLAFGVSAGIADEGAKLVINEELEMVTQTKAAAHLAGSLDEVRSGWTFRTKETQSLQMDDFDNPGMIFVDQGMDTWNTVDGAAGKSCASCHEGPEGMAGLRAKMPKWNEADEKVWTIEMYINDCRENRMEAKAWGWKSQPMLNVNALIALQSRGMPVNVKIDGPAQSTWEEGKKMYYTRYGQLELSCASCHEENYGKYIRADHLSQGQTNGFPVYRLKQANLITQHNRFKGCIRDTRAETFKEGSTEFVALELYVASRGNGLSVEAPSIRN